MIIFIYGEDTYRAKERLNILKENYCQKYSDVNLSIFDEDLDVEKIKSEVLAAPFLAEKRMVVVKNVFKLKKEVLQNFQEFIEKVPEETILIIFEEGVPDKRESLFKRLVKEKLVQEFSLLLGIELKNWIKKEIARKEGEADSASINLLADFVGNDLWQMNQEIEKLLSFNKKITANDIKTLVEAKINASIFDLVDALGLRNKRNAFKKIEDLLEAGENELYILTMIIRQIRNILLVKDLSSQGKSKDEIARIIPLHPFAVKKCLEQSHNFEFKDLKRVYQKLVDTDFAIKSGILEPDLALDLLIQEV
ncbi:MAG: DNA polymerase III subunit delta [Patescibacteria group bacterium]|nr:DNA polymerase III subunit delta [Patescibacteria group bacterium]MCL5093681.1 DNA polymerase III subunit delta [Patescibacteria group bacterium]